MFVVSFSVHGVILPAMVEHVVKIEFVKYKFFGKVFCMWVSSVLHCLMKLLVCWFSGRIDDQFRTYFTLEI